MLTAYGSPITEENSLDLIEYMATLGLNIIDDLDDIVEEYAPTGETPFAVMQVVDGEQTKMATFTVIGSSTFHGNWEVLVADKLGPFYQIKKI